MDLTVDWTTLLCWVYMMSDSASLLISTLSLLLVMTVLMSWSTDISRLDNIGQNECVPGQTMAIGAD